MSPDEVHSFARQHIRSTGEPVVTTPEVVDEFGVTPHTARARLETLVEQGRMGKKRAGRSYVYYLMG